MKFERTQEPTYTITLTENEAKALAEILSNSEHIWDHISRINEGVCEDVSSRLYELMYKLEIGGL